MKKYIVSLLLLFTATVFLNPVLYADSKKEQKAEKVKQMIDEQNFVFVAQTAIPTSMPTRSITGTYELKVTTDTVDAYLPYFGRAYVAPINEEGGIKFTSTHFDFKIVKENKNGWDINIEPKDVSRHSYRLVLFISKTGSATLQVNDVNRQPITFHGYINIKD